MSANYNAIWQFDREEETSSDSGRSISSVYTFIYDNDSVIVNLPTRTLRMDLPADDIYRIKTKWKGDDLYIFPPLGDRWELFATWDKNRFVLYGNKKVKIFKKIEPDEIAAWQKDLLKPGREMWGYPYLDPDKVEISE